MPKITISETRARAIIHSLLREAKDDNLHQFINYVRRYGGGTKLTGGGLPTVDELMGVFKPYPDVHDTIRYGFMGDNIESDPDYEDEYNAVVREIIEDVMGRLTVNERGLIYVERNITIPNFHKRDNLFNRFSHSYDGHFGEWWSYDHGNAINGGSGDEISLKGWVSPESVDWNGTICHNVMFNDEFELTLKYDEPVEIERMTAVGSRGGEYTIWNKPVVIRT